MKHADVIAKLSLREKCALLSGARFKNMKDDPEYREKILSALKRDLTSSFAPLEASMVLTVGCLLYTSRCV